MAMLLGAASLLARSQDLDGTVHFVFQPAEEHGRGAMAMIADGLFQRFPMDAIFGVHNMPGIPAGLCAAHGAGHEFDYSYEFQPTINAPQCVAPAVAAAAQVSGGNVDGDCPPVLASEDFGAFLAVIPGNYMFIGSGLPGEPGGTPLHSPLFDFNDDLLLPGAQNFATIAQHQLGR
jgi:metal-dependent amidase/aminoacylase/carboxypeptidase family protein